MVGWHLAEQQPSRYRLLAELDGSARDIVGGSPKKSRRRDIRMTVDMGIDNQNSVQSSRLRFAPTVSTTKPPK
jgi:hypothetical protein